MRPDSEAIKNFINITGVSELEATQTLEEYLGNLNDAINAHFAESNRNTRKTSASASPGTITVDKEEAPITHPAVQEESYATTDSGTSTSFLDRLPEHLIIEEQMLQAAIDALKRDIKMYSGLDDADIDLTAKEERARCALGEQVGPSRRFEPGSSFVQGEHEDVEEQPLTWYTSRHISPGSVHAAKGIVESEGSPSSTPQQPIDHHPQQKESDFRLDEDIERQLTEKEVSLPKEPLPGDENAVLLVVQMPDGSSRSRWFLKSQKLQHLFDLIDISRMVNPGTYKLA